MLSWVTLDIEEELKMLNRHFRAVTFEKHPKAMMTLLLDQIFDKVLGRNFAKQRISRKKFAALQYEMKKALQARYGRFMNIHFSPRCSTPNAIRFETNFHHAYKTEFGILYGASQGITNTRTFFTIHCFERFEERCDPEYHETVKRLYSEVHKYEPTDADLVMYLTSMHYVEYAKRDKFYYLNIGLGVLVIEDYTDFFVAKTFLAPDMIIGDGGKPLNWYMSDYNPKNEKGLNLRTLFETNQVKIEKPRFFLDWFDFKANHEGPSIKA